MSRLRRWLLFGHGHKVSRTEARQIAQAECDVRGVPWRDPIEVYRHYGDWAVVTFADHRGGNVRVVVDGGSGAVKRVMGPTPR